MSDCTNVDGSLSADHFRCQRSQLFYFLQWIKNAPITDCTKQTKILIDLFRLIIPPPTLTQQNGLRVSLPTMTVSTCRCWNLESFSNIELQISQNDFFGSTQISNHYKSIITMKTLLLPLHCTVVDVEKVCKIPLWSWKMPNLHSLNNNKNEEKKILIRAWWSV